MSTPPLTPQDITRAAALKRFRESNGLTQAEIGSMLGVSQASISQFEQAKSRMPDDVFEQLLLAAKDQMEQEIAPDIETAQARAAAEGDIPPEILDSLKAMASAGEAGDQAAAEEALRTMRSHLTDAQTASMSKPQQGAATDVRMAYTLLAKILGRFDPDLGALIDQQSGELAVSVVQAAEESPLLARLVAMLKAGPMANCIILHLMLLVQYDNIRQERKRERVAAQAIIDARRPPDPVPLHPTAAEVVDPSLAGAFAAA